MVKVASRIGKKTGSIARHRLSPSQWASVASGVWAMEEPSGRPGGLVGPSWCGCGDFAIGIELGEVKMI